MRFGLCVGLFSSHVKKKKKKSLAVENSRKGGRKTSQGEEGCDVNDDG